MRNDNANFKWYRDKVQISNIKRNLITLRKRPKDLSSYFIIQKNPIFLNIKIGSTLVKLQKKMQTSKGQIIVLRRLLQAKCQDPDTAMPDNIDEFKLGFRLLLTDIRSSCFIWVSPVIPDPAQNSAEGSGVLTSGFWVTDTED